MRGNGTSKKDGTRLQPFVDLSMGLELSDDRRLPKILENNFVEDGRPHHQQERCWKSLLLSDVDCGNNEWNLVREHFEHSRSKKVLSIIQNSEKSNAM